MSKKRKRYPHSEIVSLVIGGMDFLIQAIHKNNPEMPAEEVTDYTIEFIETTFPMLDDFEITKILNVYSDMQEYFKQDSDVTT